MEDIKWGLGRLQKIRDSFMWVKEVIVKSEEKGKGGATRSVKPIWSTLCQIWNSLFLQGS